MYLKKLSLLLASIALVKSNTIPEESEISSEEDIETETAPVVEIQEDPIVSSPYLDLTTPLDSIPKNKKGENCGICSFEYGLIKTDPFMMTYTVRYNIDGYNLTQFATGEHPDGGCQIGALSAVGYGWCCDGWLPDTTRKVDLIDCHGKEITLDFETNLIYDKNTGEVIPGSYYYQEPEESSEEDIETESVSTVETPEEDPIVSPPYLDLTTPLDSIPKNKKGENCGICSFEYGLIKTDPFMMTYTVRYNIDGYNLTQFATGEHPDGGCQNGALSAVGYGWCCDGWLPDTTRKVDLIDCHGDEITLDFETDLIYNKNTGEVIPGSYYYQAPEETSEETSEEVETDASESDVPQFA